MVNMLKYKEYNKVGLIKEGENTDIDDIENCKSYNQLIRKIESLAKTMYRIRKEGDFDSQILYEYVKDILIEEFE